MRFPPIIKKSDGVASDISEVSGVPADPEKFHAFNASRLRGMRNYLLFQKFPDFRWPAWVSTMNDPSHGGGFVMPYMMLNNVMRDCLLFTNFLSDHGLEIDLANMFSPTYGGWSLETWIVDGEEIHRPADDWSKVRQERDTKNSLVNAQWGGSFFRVSHSLFGARSSVDEVVIETDCSVKERKDALILFVARPYNRFSLGGIESVSFLRDSLGLSINGTRSICFAEPPDFTVTGDPDRGSDIDLRGEDRRASMESKSGMATLGLCYALNKGDNRFTLRISLEPKGEPPPGSFDFSRVREDFTSFSSIRIRNGANVSHPDRSVQNWIYGLKISMLNVSRGGIRDERGALDSRIAYFAVFGLNRMGFFSESLEFVDDFMNSCSPGEKHPAFGAIIDVCYLIESVADYFTHVRDADFLRDRFDRIKARALLLYGYSRKIRRMGHHGTNSLPYCPIAEEHPFDYILIAHALAQYSYLARCLGIFGDEIKFKKESDRIAVMFAAAASGGRMEDDGYVYHGLYAGFPFRADAVDDDIIRGLLAVTRRRFGGLPLLVKSYGWDMLSTLIIANNCILLKDPEGSAIIETIMKMRSRSYTLPEFIHPGTGRAAWGDGSSIAACAMMYAALRNLLFVDYAERLDIFPLPSPEWFQPGREIKVENMPSRFGSLSFRMASTANEIQIHFDRAPKFIPPDIMINLPVRTKIKQEDDFIIKREGDFSFVINGWPSIVRFLRK